LEFVEIMPSDDKTDAQPPIRSVNSQITDAVTQSNTMLTGMAPAHSMAAVYQTMAQSTGTSMQNAVSNQQNVNTVNLAALAQNIQIIMQPLGPKTVIQTLPPIVVQPPSPRKSASAEKSTNNPV
jgi:Killing trait